jgi:hypothetical protein
MQRLAAHDDGLFAKREKHRVAMVVFPGGGYNCLAIDLEGTEICDWLTSKGITGVLLKYRVPGSGPHWDSKLKRRVVPKAEFQRKPGGQLRVQNNGNRRSQSICQK